jgi:hypothetical protein
MNYIKDIARLLEENYTSVPENAAALEDLVEMRTALVELQKRGTPNIPAGMPNGMSGINDAIKEINQGIRELMIKDTDGRQWGG